MVRQLAWTPPYHSDNSWAMALGPEVQTPYPVLGYIQHSLNERLITFKVKAKFIFFLQTSSIVFLSRAPYPKEIRFFVCSFLAENFHFSLGFLPPPSSSDLDSWIGDFKPLDLDLQCLRVDLVPGGAVLVHSIVRRRSPRHPLPRLHFSGWNFPRVAFLLTPTPDVVGRFSLPLLLGRLLAHFLGSTGIVQMTLAVRYRKEGAIACANLSQMPPSPLILLPLRF
ncbi:uncharacterized protein LOC109839322 [Asparagus officinalis]|uniref:uncharacterized protein LOC109839322 n=1 Tax=Asparagus officinalis TaxID=4686 RepID=UPI00098E6FED|nr:uncharacterized protein LOC109839322 [Asparagus officinalis]